MMRRARRGARCGVRLAMIGLWAFLPAALLAAEGSDGAASLFDGGQPAGASGLAGMALPPAPETVAAQPLAAAGQEPAGSDWEPDHIPDPQQPGTETSPTAPEQKRFWERLQNKAFNDICSKIRLPLKKDVDLSQYGNVGVGGERRLERYPNKKLAMADSVNLDLSLGYGKNVLETVMDNLPLTISASARAEGDSVVIRPLEGEKSCREIRRLLDVRDFKTILPIKAGRFADMAVGELWKMQLLLSIRGEAGVGDRKGVVVVGFSCGHTQQEAAGLTIFRLSDDQIRVRLRIDRANITDTGGRVSLDLPIAQYAALTDSSNMLEKQVDRLIERQIRRYVEGALGLSAWKQEGRKVMLEFVLNPHDPERMEALEEFIKGDLDLRRILRKNLSAAANPLAREGAEDEYLSGVKRDNAERLGVSPSFSGVDDHASKGWSFPLRLPILGGVQLSSSHDSDEIVREPETDVVVHMDQASRPSDRYYLDLPGLGEIFKRNSQRTVQAFTKADSKGFPDSPMLAYIQQEGFLRGSEEAARGMVEDINGIMRYAGTQGEGVNERLELPALFPKREAPPAAGPSGDSLAPGDLQPIDVRLYRSAASAFTLILNQRALTDILWAPAERVVKAYANALQGNNRVLMGKLLENAVVSEDGSIDYDSNKVRQALGLSVEGPENVMATVQNLARTAARLAADLVKAREGDWRGRCSALADVISGSGFGKPAYEDVMRVLVQLTDPGNLYAEVSVQTDKKIKGEDDVSARYYLNKANAADKVLRDYVEYKARFAGPPFLAD